VARRAIGTRDQVEAVISAELLQTAAAIFGILAAPVRLHIVWLLAQSERDVTSLADEVGATVQVISQHLAKLRLAELVQARRDGRRQVYLVSDPHLVAVVGEMVAHLRRPTERAKAARGVGS
jgi:DNA-binding transcriptional ArsR family regulator